MNSTEQENRGVILGVDFGLKRVGLAVCDTERRIAVGVGWLENLSGRTLIRRIRSEAEARQASQIVIGCPQGGGRNVDEVRNGIFRLADGLRKLNIKVALYEEDFSTYRVLQDRKRIGGKSSKRKGWADEAAAVLILQDYLDSLNSGN